jgi:hypothetical protein
VLALGKLAMATGYVNNTRIEEVVFEIDYMEFPYNSIIGRGTLNIFKAVLHSTYLCMKLPHNQGVISLYGKLRGGKKDRMDLTRAQNCLQY